MVFTACPFPPVFYFESMVLTMKDLDPLTDSYPSMKPDASDFGIEREQLMFDGELLDDDGYAIYGRLHSHRAGNPRMTLQDLYKQLWIWRCWRRCNGDYALVARRMSAFGWPNTTVAHVRYRIRRMEKSGYFDHLRYKVRVR